MQPLKKRADELKSEIHAATERLQIAANQEQLEKLDRELAKPEVWNDSTHAQDLSKQAAALRALVEPWQNLASQVSDIEELLAMDDDSIQADSETQISTVEQEFAMRKKDLLFNGEYDNHDAIIRITSGVGGTDAQDWAEMLERMYLRWAEKAGMATKNVERSTGEEAGIKTSVIEVSGPFAYGKLRSENGVHRLVRLSPFNSDNLRQTSFALIEILPQIDAPEEVEIDDKDLKIDVYRAGGHGGQSVNTTALGSSYYSLANQYGGGNSERTITVAK